MRRRWIFLALTGIALTVVAAWPAPAPVSHQYFAGLQPAFVENIAHGGGQGHAPPNTLEALQLADEMGADVLEIDLQLTKDGVLVLHHDDTLDRITDMKGPIAAKTWAELQKADSGYHTVIDGQSFRGKGIKIARLEEAFTRFPSKRWVIEIKNDNEASNRLCALISQFNQSNRVIVASFHDGAMKTFRKACPKVATAYSGDEVRVFLIASHLRLSRFVQSPGVALQIPTFAAGFDLTDPHFVSTAKSRGLKVQYWTINDPKEMRHLIERKADGIMTDYVDRVKQVMPSVRP
ncbi:glycerophosphodiester phosphodiesterase [Aquidulcibacter sp.]|jgi:glycerophosphoryl diester phosphodiesterase|uniref:glycerophosphodiester phosphodiesterase n=1 Tax=Aquidulcibacter sp. TaxID=2052990 RepID=UPI0037847146